MEKKFFGEWVKYETAREKEQAYYYLYLWKKFFLKKATNMEQIGNDQIILREYIESFNGNREPIKTLGIKIQMKEKVCE